jgi:hypothetical protein
LLDYFAQEPPVKREKLDEDIVHEEFLHRLAGVQQQLQQQQQYIAQQRQQQQLQQQQQHSAQQQRQLLQPMQMSAAQRMLPPLVMGQESTPPPTCGFASHDHHTVMGYMPPSPSSVSPLSNFNPMDAGASNIWSAAPAAALPAPRALIPYPPHLHVTELGAYYCDAGHYTVLNRVPNPYNASQAPMLSTLPAYP